MIAEDQALLRNDVISKRMVLSKIKEVCFSEKWKHFRADYGSKGQTDFLINYIEQLSSITLQSKTGHWVDLNKNNEGHCDDYGDPYVKCSECSICNGTDQSDFCPNCGAKMQEVEE